MIKQFFKSFLGSGHVGTPALEAAPSDEKRPEMTKALAIEYMNQGSQFLAAGELDRAEQCYRQAIAAHPDFAEAHNNLGLVLKQKGIFDQAAACYQKAINLQPDYAEPHYNLGDMLDDHGKLNEAIACYQKALALKLDYVKAHNGMGVTRYAQGKLDEAISCYQRAITFDPGFVKAYSNLGAALHDQGKHLEAKASYQKALAINPDFVEALSNLGNTFNELGQTDEAIACYQRALAIKPDFVAAHSNLGNVFNELGRSDEAAANYRQALQIKPDNADVLWKLAMAQIPAVAGSSDEIAASRKKFLRELAGLNAWFDASRAALGHNVVGTAQPFYLAYQEENNRDILLQYGTLCTRLMKNWQNQQALPSSTPAQSNAIRVGIVSAHLSSHSVWYAIVKGWLQHLNRDRIELHLFHIGYKQDTETNLAKSLSSSFQQGKKGLRQWVDAILAKQVDVLIYPEISMDPMTIKLASMRLAPVQVASWGHPETTGLPTMDYYLSAAYLEPQDAQNYYTEQLICLPHLGCYYHPEPVANSVPDFASLGIVTGVPLLLCPGTPFKYAPQHDHVFVEIAHKLGKCQFVFFTHRLHGLSAKLRQRLECVFANANMNFNDYCAFIPWQERPVFYGLMKQADVFLDTIGFSGFNTAMQAVECGLPMVTKEGRFMRGRLASGILRRMGITELIANTEDDYVNLAVKLAQDAEYRQDVRKRIETARPVLFDDVAPVRALEDFLVNVVNPNFYKSGLPG